MANKKIIVVQDVSKKSQKKKKVGNKKKPLCSSKVRLLSSSVGQAIPIQNYIIAPDVFGPARIPRAGSTSKTGLGFDRSIISLTGNSTNLVQGIVMYGSYSSSYRLMLAATAATNFSQGAQQSPSIQFPQSNQIDDVAFTAACITVTYTGQPLYAAGEILVGVVSIDAGGLGTCTYTNLQYYPSFIRVPIASLVDNPLRVFAVKTSPTSDAFINPAVEVTDVLRPIVVTNNIPVGQSVSVEVTRSWEYHTTVANNSTVPYEIQGSGLSQDVQNYQDTMAELGSVPIPVEPMFNEYVREFAMGIAGSLVSNAGPFAAELGRGVYSAIANRHMRRIGGV